MSAKPSKVVTVINDNPACRTCEMDAHKEGNPITADSARCKACPNGKIRDVPTVENYSQTKRVALRLLGDKARVWHSAVQTQVQVGFDLNPGRKVLGDAPTFQGALEKAVAAHRS